MLIEVLVSVCVFSVGVLSIVGMQANAAKDSVEAKFRSDASLLVDDLIGRMWAGDRNASVLGANFQTGGDQFNAWLTAAQSVLPEVDAAQTSVTVTPVAGGAGTTSQVVIDLAWRARNDPSGTARHHIKSVTQISG